MVNKKFWLGILLMALVFGMAVVGCGNDSTDEEEPPPPETATVSISIKEVPQQANMSTESGEVWVDLELSSGKWVGIDPGGNGYYAPGAADKNVYFYQFQSWISVKDKNNNTLGEVDRLNANKITRVGAGIISSARVVRYIISVGKNTNLSGYKPITATIDQSKLNEMQTYTNIKRSLTAGAKTSDTLN